MLLLGLILMVCTLKNLGLVKELSMKKNIDPKEIKQNYKEHIKVIKNKAYIEKHVLPYSDRKILTDLDCFLPASIFMELSGVNKSDFFKRINFMRENNTKSIFNWIELYGLVYIEVPCDVLELFSTHTAYPVTYKDNDFDHLKLVGDFKIGFWK